jgi:hypothetical protein
MKGRFIEFQFNEPRFSCAKHTILLTHEKSRIPIDSVIKKINRVRPTSHVTIFVSIPWEDKNDPNITNGFEDAHENFHFLFQKFKNSDEYILVLEDDHEFWSMFDWEAKSIDRFVVGKQPDVYLLGHMSQFSEFAQFPHLKCNTTCGLHAQFIHSRVLLDWCDNGIHHFRASRDARTNKSNNPASMDTNSNVHAILRCDRREVFSYARPVATQTFPKNQSNRNMWEHSCSWLEVTAMRVLRLHECHSGWLVIYVYCWGLSVCDMLNRLCGR